MKRTAMQHTKLKRLVRALKVPQYAAVGILESLWHLTAREAPEGNIGKLSNEDIAAWIDWDGSADDLIAGLVSAGWLDESTSERLEVHDWMEHADESVRKILQRKGVDTTRASGQRIYFIRAVVTGLIKIGITEGNLQSRLLALQTGSAEKLELLGAIEGNRKLEAELHKQFAGCRAVGEWFRPTDGLLQYISDAVGCRILPLASDGSLPVPVPVPVPVPSQSHISKASPSHPEASLGEVSKADHEMAIYEAYPRKEGKGAALEAIRKAVARLVKGEVPHAPMVKIDAQRYLMRRVLEYERSPVGRQPDKTKLPHPATWFNQKRYDDDQSNWHHTETGNGTYKGKTGHSIDAATRAIQEIEDRAAADRFRNSAAGEAGRAGLPSVCGGSGELGFDGLRDGPEGIVISPPR